MLRSILIAMLLSSQGLWAQEGSLFPVPFRVQHHLEHQESEGERMVFDSVIDTYGGSWIVSERSDGSRLIIDFVRHEIIEVQPQRGTYWVVSMDRLSDLQQRLAAVDAVQKSDPEPAEPADLDAAASLESAFIVKDGPSLAAASLEGGSLASRPGILHLQAVDRSQSPLAAPAFEAWFDASVQLSAEATSALDSLAAKLGGAPSEADSLGPLGAMRSRAGGALAIRTSRSMGGGSQGELSRIDDIATQVERLQAFPGELLEIPEGFVRTSHPLEAAVRYLEQDEEWRRQIGGGESTP